MTAGGMRETAQHSHRRRFAGSIRTEKTEDGTSLDFEREVLHGMDVTVPLAQMIKPDDRFIHLDLYCGDRLDLQPSVISQQVICHEH
jgi:hypothetical protein